MMSVSPPLTRQEPGAYIDDSATPATIPNVPTGLTLTIDAGQIAASWTAPADGGDSIIGYSVQHKLNTSATWLNSGHSGTGTSFIIDMLAKGSSYNVRVAAINNVGTGPYVDGSATTPTEPGTPESLSLIAGHVSGTGVNIGVSWNAPSSTGGISITGYSVQYKEFTVVPWTTWTHSGTTTAATITEPAISEGEGTQ